MKTANLRWVEPKDMKAVLGLIQELADFEKEPDAVVITEDDLQNHAFGQRPKFKCLVAEKEGQVIGMVILSALFYMERPNVSFRRSNCDPKRTRNRSWKGLVYSIY